MRHALKLVLGSQSVSGQHSTGKGIVAVADRAGTGGEPILRAGAAILANHALLGIDEIGMMSYEDQEQFLSLMETGYFDFNKMGIRQRLVSEAGFIINSNTISGRWHQPDRVSVDEIPLKGQLVDRLDLIFIFRNPRTQSETDEFADNMYKLSKKQFNLDFIFLRKYIYYILSNPKFDNIDFEDKADTLRLRDFWKNLMRGNPEFAGNRSFESVFKIASAFARLTLKTTVDYEVVETTIDYLTLVFAKHGTQVTKPVDYLSLTYLEICNIVKKHSVEKSWAERNGPETVRLADITFNQAAEIAAKNNSRIADYLGTNFRSSVNKAARRLRERFRDSQDKDFDNGKIKIVSPDGHELKLRWIPNT